MKSRYLSSVLLFHLLVFLLAVLVLSPSPTKVLSAVANHVVISEIQIAGATTTDEFIELYNPTDSDIDLSNWRLAKKTPGGDESDVIAATMSGTIPASGYFLIAHTDYDDVVTPNETYSGPTTFSDNNTVLLYNADDILIDKVGMGTAIDSETSPFDNPITNRSIERKALPDSTAADMATGGINDGLGNGEDTDNNSIDFVRHMDPIVSNPQNSTSAIELPPQPSPTPTSSPETSPESSPTTSPDPNASPDVSASPSPEATPISSPSPTSTPTPSPTPDTSPSATPEATTTPTTSPSPTPQATIEPTPTTSPTPEASVSPTPEPTPEASPSPTPEPSPTPDVLGKTIFKGTLFTCRMFKKTIYAGWFKFKIPVFRCERNSNLKYLKY